MSQLTIFNAIRDGKNYRFNESPCGIQMHHINKMYKIILTLLVMKYVFIRLLSNELYQLTLIDISNTSRYKSVHKLFFLKLENFKYKNKCLEIV